MKTEEVKKDDLRLTQEQQEAIKKAKSQYAKMYREKRKSLATEEQREAIKKARREYQKMYRARNPEKIKAAITKTWLKKAAALEALEKEQALQEVNHLPNIE